MRIALVGNFYNPSWDGSKPDEENIASSFERLGHQVYRLQREQLTENMPNVNFTIIAQWSGYNSDLLAKLPRPLVYWAFDYQHHNQEWHMELIRQADVYLSKRFADNIFPNWHWFYDFAPDFLDAQRHYPKEIDVLFTGSYLPWATERTEILKAVDQHFNLQVNTVTPNKWREQGLKNVQGAVMDEALPDLIGRAKIVLSIDHTIEEGYWSDRNAQTMVCGGFVLFRYVPFSEHVFHRNVAYFRTVDECLEDIGWYLQRESYTQEVAKAGYQYAKENLTCTARVLDLLTIMENR